jgi:hypothetical protein
LYNEIPTLYSVNQLSSKLNNVLLPINNATGFYVNVENKLTTLLTCFYKNNTVVTSTVKIKISADGFQVTKRGKKMLVSTFTIIEPHINVNSSDGHFVMGKYLNYWYLN